LPHILLLASLLLFQSGFAQQAPADPGDCLGAFAINDSVVVCDRPGRGFGNILEIKENPATDLQWLEREHHSTWYLFRAPVTTLLTFDIIPKNPEDDIDFLLFGGNVPDICSKIQAKQVMPLRSNISRNNRSLNSTCGLSKDATEDYVRSGVGSSYSRAIDIKEGELYYLLVDYPDRPRDGFTIRFHYDPPPPPPVAEVLPQKLSIHVTDELTGGPVDASLTIEGMRFDSVVEAKGNSHYEFRMETYRRLKVSCLRKGYMFHSEKLVTNGDDEVELNIKLAPISTGAHVVLNDIRFVGNESKVMRNSEASLYLLLRFMQQNPEAKVEIQGHVNGPTFKKNSKEFIELSESRARTVYNFLLVNDIDPGRVTYVGLGNSQMLFPNPKNQDESEANRRVEVRITAYDALATPSGPGQRRPSH
jgi:outer membrane protein OmpA-like peptidoglycan-associated protein